MPRSEVASPDPATVSGLGVGLDDEELATLLVARYEAYWDAFDGARRRPSFEPSLDHPGLAELSAGEQLAVSYQAVTTLAQLGQAVREPDTQAVGAGDAAAEHRVRVVSVDGPVAELATCMVDDDVRYLVGTGSVISDEVATVEAMATMAVSDGSWKLIRSSATAVTPGVSGCWLRPDTDYPN